MKLILALAMGVLSAAAHAEVVTYTFSGAFDAPSTSPWEAPATSSGPLAFGLVKQGDRFSGQFTFDTNAPGKWISIEPIAPADWAYYPTQSFEFKGPNALNHVVPAWNAPYGPEDGPAINVLVGRNDFGKPWSDPTTSYNILNVYGAANQDATYRWNVGLSFQSDKNTFDYPRLPVGYNDFSSGQIELQLINNVTGGRDFVTGTAQIQLANVSPVPEPSSALMLLAGLAGVGGIARLRRRA